MKVGIENKEFSLADENAIELEDKTTTTLTSPDVCQMHVDDTSEIKRDNNTSSTEIKNRPVSHVDIITVKRSVGLLGAVSIVLGSMIGSGIFASTAPVISHSKSVGLSLVIWCLSGIVCTGTALCYVELGTMIPKSGGEFIYLREAYGELPAFLFSFTTILILKPAQLTAIVLATGDYVTEPFAVLRHDHEARQVVSKIVAASCLGLIVFVNCISVRLALRVQVVFTAAKLCALTMLIITGLVKLCQGMTENFDKPFSGSASSISDLGFAFYGSLWAYDSWNNLNFLIDEIKDPFKTLPRAIMIGIPTTTFFYVMINVAYSVVLTNSQIANSKAVAVMVSTRCYGIMWWIMPVLVACSCFGSANGTTFSVGRLIYVSAREGHMPEVLAMVQTKRQTPIPALTFTCIIGWIMIAPNSSNFVTLINYFNFAAWIFYGLTISTVLWLRYKKPDLKRPYKVFLGVPVICLLCAVYLVVAPFAKDPWPSFGCLCFILMGIPLYLSLIKYKICPQPILKGFNTFTKMLQKIFNLSIPEAARVDSE